MYLAAVGSTVYFSALEATRGEELWKSNGTAGATTIVGDILPGIGSSNPSLLTQVGTRLYFDADDGVSGTELWSYIP